MVPYPLLGSLPQTHGHSATSIASKILQPTHIGDEVIATVEFIEEHAETGEAG